MKLLLLAVCCLCCTAIRAQNIDTSAGKISGPVKKEVKKWYESFSIRGYVQVRYNRLLETNPKLKCEQCDRSIGEGGGFIIRRGRIIISGNK